MELLLTTAEFLTNFDQYIIEAIQRYGMWATLIIFAIIFCETGLVVTPFLPGDSLLFVIGALGARDDINIFLIAVVVTAAAVSGNMVNYQIGRFMGPRIFDRKGTRFFNREHLIKTKAFFECHGGKTIIISRFIPYLRTFVPFVAGIGRMKYGRFLIYNLTGGILWVASFFISGYYFGNMPIVEDNFSIIVTGTIVIALVPGFISLVYKGRHSYTKPDPKNQPQVNKYS